MTILDDYEMFKNELCLNPNLKLVTCGRRCQMKGNVCFFVSWKVFAKEDQILKPTCIDIGLWSYQFVWEIRWSPLNGALGWDYGLASKLLNIHTTLW